MEYLLLIIGFVLLIKGADFFVDGSSSLARFLKIPSVIIGLTIVAMEPVPQRLLSASMLHLPETMTLPSAMLSAQTFLTVLLL